MAKRKAVRASRRSSSKAGKKAGARKAAGRGRAAARKTASRKRAAPKARAAKKTAKKAVKAKARASKSPRGRASKPARASAARPTVRAAKPKGTPPKRKAAAKSATSTAIRKVVARPAAPAGRKRAPIPIMRKPPSLDRERRIVRDEDDLIQQTPPSSLDLDRSASAVRTGRRVLKERFDEHTETSPALTAGDVDADWESAYSVGDEAPGGDNPTPDQDIVDDIGRAVGVEYQDNEELKGEEKIAKRDRNRWELDPASSDDWDDR